jgi:predicted lipoprotein with Yx(FWY)xxD motif
MSSKRRIAIAGTVAIAGLTLAACGAGGGDAAKPKSGVQVPVANAAPNTQPQAAQNPPEQSVPVAAPKWKGWLVLSTAQNAQLGTTVVNGKGFTVYRFDNDTAKPPVSNCFGACAKLWPPVKFTKKLKLTGIPRSAIGNIMTKDGICQATLNGWPLYTYAKDTAPGQINGQGVKGTWFAIAPDGSKAAGGKVPAQNAPGGASGTSGSGYGSGGQGSGSY